jgi:hypothetical protein
MYSAALEKARIEPGIVVSFILSLGAYPVLLHHLHWQLDALTPRLGLISSYPEYMPSYIVPVPGYHCLKYWGSLCPFFLFVLFLCRCTPNPCEHGGVCKQNSNDFFCECEHTGYTGIFPHFFLLIEKQILKVVVLCLGAVCHTSLNWFSCVQFQNRHPDSR